MLNDHKRKLKKTKVYNDKINSLSQNHRDLGFLGGINIISVSRKFFYVRELKLPRDKYKRGILVSNKLNLKVNKAETNRVITINVIHNFVLP